MSDSSPLAFAQERPASVEPYIASYQRPSFNVAGAMDTANKFAMAQKDAEGQLGVNAVVLEQDGVVAGLGVLVFVVEARAVAFAGILT